MFTYIFIDSKSTALQYYIYTLCSAQLNSILQHSKKVSKFRRKIFTWRTIFWNVYYCLTVYGCRMSVDGISHNYKYTWYLREFTPFWIPFSVTHFARKFFVHAHIGGKLILAVSLRALHHALHTLIIHSTMDSRRRIEAQFIGASNNNNNTSNSTRRWTWTLTVPCTQWIRAINRTRFLFTISNAINRTDWQQFTCIQWNFTCFQ